MSDPQDKPNQRCCLGLMYFSQVMEEQGKRPVRGPGMRDCCDSRHRHHSDLHLVACRSVWACHTRLQSQCSFQTRSSWPSPWSSRSVAIRRLCCSQDLLYPIATIFAVACERFRHPPSRIVPIVTYTRVVPAACSLCAWGIPCMNSRQQQASKAVAQQMLNIQAEGRDYRTVKV